MGIYSNPGDVIAYADGERQEFSICFAARIVGGHLAVGDQESTEVPFVNPRDIETLPTGLSTRLRLQHFLERRMSPYFA
ncbi:MAG: DNA mismatch repair protein MutT [Chloroflexi bacterium]|nr:DNA mismatch repair protein MutT [Chloroflexota bacterium]